MRSASRARTACDDATRGARHQLEFDVPLPSAQTRQNHTSYAASRRAMGKPSRRRHRPTSQSSVHRLHVKLPQRPSTTIHTHQHNTAFTNGTVIRARHGRHNRARLQSAPAAGSRRIREDQHTISSTNAWMLTAPPEVLLHRGASVTGAHQKPRCTPVTLPRVHDSIQGWLYIRRAAPRTLTAESKPHLRPAPKWVRTFVIFDVHSASLIERGPSGTQHVTVLERSTEVVRLGLQERELGMHQGIYAWAVTNRKRNIRKRLVLGCSSCEEAFEWMQQVRQAIATKRKHVDPRSELDREQHSPIKCHSQLPTCLPQVDAGLETTSATLASSRTVESGISVSVLRQVHTFDHIPVQRELLKHGMTLVRATRLHRRRHLRGKHLLNSPSANDQANQHNVNATLSSDAGRGGHSEAFTRDEIDDRVESDNESFDTGGNSFPEPKWKVVTIKEASAGAIQSQVRGYLARKHVFGRGGLSQRLNDAARKMQTFWRAQLARRRALQVIRRHKAAITIQCQFRAFKIRACYRHVIVTAIKACRIQRWFRYIIAMRRTEAVHVTQFAFATVSALAVCVCAGVELRRLFAKALRRMVVKALVSGQTRRNALVVVQRWIRRVQEEQRWKCWHMWQGYVCRTAVDVVGKIQITLHANSSSIVIDPLYVGESDKQNLKTVCGDSCSLNTNVGDISSVFTVEEVTSVPSALALQPGNGPVKSTTFSPQEVVRMAREVDIGSRDPVAFFRLIHAYQSGANGLATRTSDDATGAAAGEWVHDACERVTEAWNVLEHRAPDRWAETISASSELVGDWAAMRKLLVEPLVALDAAMERLTAKHCSTLRRAISFAGMSQTHAARECLEVARVSMRSKEVRLIAKQRALLQQAEDALRKHDAAIQVQLRREMVDAFGHSFVESVMEHACVGFEQARNAVARYFATATHALVLKVRSLMLAQEMVTKRIIPAAEYRVLQVASTLEHTRRLNYISRMARKAAEDMTWAALNRAVCIKAISGPAAWLAIGHATCQSTLHKLEAVRTSADDLVAGGICVASKRIVGVKHAAWLTVRDVESSALSNVQRVQLRAAEVRRGAFAEKVVHTILSSAVSSSVARSLVAIDVVRNAVATATTCTIGMQVDLERPEQDHHSAKREEGNDDTASEKSQIIGHTVKINDDDAGGMAIEEPSSPCHAVESNNDEDTGGMTIEVEVPLVPPSLCDALEINYDEERCDMATKMASQERVSDDEDLRNKNGETRVAQTLVAQIFQHALERECHRFVAKTCVDAWMEEVWKRCALRRLVAEEYAQYVLDTVAWNLYEREQDGWAAESEHAAATGPWLIEGGEDVGGESRVEYHSSEAGTDADGQARNENATGGEGADLNQEDEMWGKEDEDSDQEDDSDSDASSQSDSDSDSNTSLTNDDFDNDEDVPFQWYKPENDPDAISKETLENATAEVLLTRLDSSKYYLASLLDTLHDGLSSSVALVKRAACTDVRQQSRPSDRHAPLFALHRVERAQEVLQDRFDDDPVWASVELERHCHQILRRIRAITGLIDTLQRQLGCQELTKAPDYHRPRSQFTAHQFVHLARDRRCRTTADLLSTAEELDRTSVELRKGSRSYKKVRRREEAEARREFMRTNPLDDYNPGMSGAAPHNLVEKVLGFTIADAMSDNRIGTTVVQHLHLGMARAADSMHDAKVRWSKRCTHLMQRAKRPGDEVGLSRATAARRIQKMVRAFRQRRRIREEKARLIQATWRSRLARQRTKGLMREMFEEMHDPISGCTFYFNKKTGTTQWEAPVMLARKSDTSGDGT